MGGCSRASVGAALARYGGSSVVRLSARHAWPLTDDVDEVMEVADADGRARGTAVEVEVAFLTGADRLMRGGV